jgi:hypothetical protein
MVDPEAFPPFVQITENIDIELDRCLEIHDFLRMGPPSFAVGHNEVAQAASYAKGKSKTNPVAGRSKFRDHKKVKSKILQIAQIEGNADYLAEDEEDAEDHVEIAQKRNDEEDDEDAEDNGKNAQQLGDPEEDDEDKGDVEDNEAGDLEEDDEDNEDEEENQDDSSSSGNASSDNDDDGEFEIKDDGSEQSASAQSAQYESDDGGGKPSPRKETAQESSDEEE